MHDIPRTIWYSRTTFDRKVAYPGESLFAGAMVKNATRYPIFIGNSYWRFTCYTDRQPGVKQINSTLEPDGAAPIPPCQLAIPEIQKGQYEAYISIDTWIWNSETANWRSLGTIHPDRGEPFYIIQNPRFRAFISRSNRDVDRPIADAILSVIQSWGFDTHTVGINEIEHDSRRVPERILEEITKADCVFAIATPRDVSSMPNLFRTLTWLDNEVSFSFVSRKPTLLMADETVMLDGLTGTAQIPIIRFSARDLGAFLRRLHGLMPVIRRILVDQEYQRWEQARIQEIEEIRYQSFMSGIAYQKRLLLGE